MIQINSDFHVISCMFNFEKRRRVSLSVSHLFVTKSPFNILSSARGQTALQFDWKCYHFSLRTRRTQNLLFALMYEKDVPPNSCSWRKRCEVLDFEHLTVSNDKEMVRVSHSLQKTMGMVRLSSVLIRFSRQQGNCYV